MSVPNQRSVQSSTPFVQVWDLKTLARKSVLSGHTGAILALQFVPECDWLISSSGELLLA